VIVNSEGEAQGKLKAPDRCITLGDDASTRVRAWADALPEMARWSRMPPRSH